ncbi:MAG TPA: hypothetical protein VE053_06915 [Allosphingosinicella sp.]|nr:hypothetical protein [Allosphingosinicella sp.]
MTQDLGNPPELRRPMMVQSSHQTALEASMIEQLTDDVTHIVQRVPFVECAPARLWSIGLLSELEDASAKLAAKVAKLKEAQGADR